MPIKIPRSLPAFQTLENENIFVMSDERASQQDIRPLSIAILNLMPKKIETETQLLRLLSNTPLQVDIDLVQTVSHRSKNTSEEHLFAFYTTFDEIKDKRFDGLIITGAPVEHMKFEDVDYWGELCKILEWSKTNVFSVMHICWAAQASLYYNFGIEKYNLDKKMFGIFPHKITMPNHPLLKGFDEVFYVPQSRHTEVKRQDIEKISSLQILSTSDVSGVNIVSDLSNRHFYITGHFEYDRNTIANEFYRDLKKGLDIQVPYSYFPNDDIEREPVFNWSGSANLMFSNWLNYCVYQQTPFDLKDLQKISF